MPTHVRRDGAQCARLVRVAVRLDAAALQPFGCPTLKERFLVVLQRPATFVVELEARGLEVPRTARFCDGVESANRYLCSMQERDGDEALAASVDALLAGHGLHRKVFRFHARPRCGARSRPNGIASKSESANRMRRHSFPKLELVSAIAATEACGPRRIGA